MNQDFKSQDIFEKFYQDPGNNSLLKELHAQGLRMLKKIEIMQQHSQEAGQEQWVQPKQQGIDFARNQGRILAHWHQLASALEQSLVHLEQAQNLLQLDEMSGYPELSESVFHALHHCQEALNHLGETPEK